MKSFNVDLFPADAITFTTSNSDASISVPPGWYIICTATSSGTTSLSMNTTAATGSPAVVPAGFFPVPLFVRPKPNTPNPGAAAVALVLHAVTNTSSATGVVTLIPLTPNSGS